MIDEEKEIEQPAAAEPPTPAAPAKLPVKRKRKSAPTAKRPLTDEELVGQATGPLKPAERTEGHPDAPK